MTDFSINGIKTSGSIYELKPGVSIKEAQEKGKNDKIDQVYFESNGKNFVLQGEGLNLNGYNRGDVPASQVNLSGQKIQVEIQGKKVDAIIASSGPEDKIEINGKKIDAKIIAVDDEVNTKGEAFGKGVDSLAGKIGVGLGAATFGLGVIFGMGNFIDTFKSYAPEPMPGIQTVLAGAAIIGVSFGATGLYEMYQSSKTTAKPEQLKPLLGNIANF